MIGLTLKAQLRSLSWTTAINKAAWAAAVLFVLFVVSDRGPLSQPMDYRLMWTVAMAAEENSFTEDIYSPGGYEQLNTFIRSYIKEGEHRGRLSPRRVHMQQVVFSPALLGTFALLQGPQLDIDWHRFLISSRIIFGLGILVLAASLGVHGLLAFAAVYLATIPSWSYRMGLFLGNMGPLLSGLFMLCIPLLKGRKPVLLGIAGFLFGLIASWKATLLMPIPLLMMTMVVQKQWKDLYAFGAGVVLAAVWSYWMPYLVLGDDVSWQGWIEYVPKFGTNDSWLRGGTFIAKAKRYVGLGGASPLDVTVNSWVVNAALIFGWYWTSRVAPTPTEIYGRDAGTMAGGALFYLLTGPIVHSHYFVQAVGAGVVAMRPRAVKNWFYWPRIALAFGGIFLLGGHRVIRHWDIGASGTNHSFITYCGVILLLALLFEDRISRIRAPKAKDLTVSSPTGPST